MTYEEKTPPGLVGYVLILVIFAALVGPVVLTGL